jgi:hypothetical protein
MEHLVLKEVGFNNLKKGTKYIIKRCNEIHFIGNFNYYITNYENSANFNNAYSINGTTKIFVCTLNFYDKKSRYEILNHKYYKVIYKKEKIQQAMELRAVNIILRSIIGDASFVY